MNFQDIDDALSNYVPKDKLYTGVKDQMLNLLYQIEDIKAPEEMKTSTLIGLYAKDPVQYNLLLELMPENRKEFQKIRYGGEWEWRPEQVANLMGYKSVEDMFDKDRGWKSLIIKDNPERENENFEYWERVDQLEPGSLRKWFDKEQEYRDRQQKYGSPQYKALSFVAPRVVEDLKKTGDFTGKDLGLDIAENTVQFIPIGRGIGIAKNVLAKPVANAIGKAKLARGVSRLNKGEPIETVMGDLYKGTEAGKGILSSVYSHPEAIKGVYGVTSAGFAPLAMETADALAYTPEENLDRAEFNVKDVAEGTGTNLAAPILLGKATSLLGRRSGLGSSNASAAAELFGANDPYINMLIDKKAVKYGKGHAPSSGERFWADKEKNAKVVSMVEEGKKQAEKKGTASSDVKSWKEGSGKEHEQAREAILENLQIPNEENLSEFYTIGFNEKNPKAVSETRALELLGLDNAYGYDDAGNIVFIKKDFNPEGKINSRHGIALPTGPEEYSFRNRKAAEKAEIAKKGGDPDFPGNVFKGDEILRKASNDPEVRSILAGSRAGLIPQSTKNLIGNKLGQQKYGSSLIGMVGYDTKDLDYGFKNEEVVKLLKDPTVIRQWEAGFVPKKIEGDPTWEAYQLWQKIKKE